MVTTLFKRTSPDEMCPIDLTRDLAALTHPLSEEERAEFIEGLKPMLTDPTSVLQYSSVDEFEKNLLKSKPDWKGFFGYNAVFSKVRDQARRIHEHTAEITLSNGDLFYDFDPIASPQSSLAKSVDLYVNFRQKNHMLFYVDLVCELQKPDTGQAAIIGFFQQGAQSSHLMNFMDGAYEEQNRSNQISRTIDTDDQFDFSEIPHEVFENIKPLHFNADEIAFTMSCLYSFSTDEISTLFPKLCEKFFPSQEKADYQDISQVKEMIFAALEFIYALSETMQISTDNALFSIAQALDVYAGIEQDMASKTFLSQASQKHSAPDSLISFIDTQTQAIETNRTAIQTLKTLCDNDQDIISLVINYYYLKPTQMQNIIAALQSHNVAVVEELKILCGLSFPDILTIISESFDKTVIVSDWKLPRAFENYTNYQEGKDACFENYTARAQEIIQDNGYDDICTPEMIQIIIGIESEGRHDSVSPTERHFGVMQIGQEAYQAVTGKRLSLADLKTKVYGAPNWRHCIDIGTRYFHDKCLLNFNPQRSLALALGNYNWGAGYMLKYRMHHMYGFNNTTSLSEETRQYIAKYLVYNRMFSNQDYATTLIDHYNNPRQNTEVAQLSL